MVALLVLGPKRLPEAGRSIGQGLRNFKTSVNGEEADRRVPAVTSQTEHAEPTASGGAPVSTTD